MGIPMEVVGIDARLLRDEAGTNLSYKPIRSRLAAPDD